MTLEDELGRLERRALGGSHVAGFLRAVELIRRIAETDEARARALIRSLSSPNVEAALREVAAAAYSRGLISASAMLDVTAPSSKLPRAFDRAAKKSAKTIAAQVAAAAVLLKAGADIADLLAPLLGAAASIRRSIRTTTVQAGNLGVVVVTRREKVPMVWVAETDACVHCLAYSGVVVQPGERFPAGLTYAAKSPHTSALVAPPLHPNCRCFLEPLRDQSYADALRREADRSVLRGFSLDTESMRVRIDAADRLLKSNPDAPKSVIAYAQRMVKAGRFATRGRPVR